MDLPVLYRDEHLVAIDKPPGMLVHRDARHPDATVVLQTVRDQLNCRVYPVQRLDKPTSGAMILALSSADAALLQQSLATASKVYTALCRWPRRRIPRADGVTLRRWECHDPLPNKRGNLKDARTEFALMEDFGRCALVQATLHSGRHHQVRRHAHAQGRTLLGEPVYGEEWLVQWARGRLGLERLFLHMGELTLVHPRSGAAVRIESPLPCELQSALGQARKLQHIAP